LLLLYLITSGSAVKTASQPRNADELRQAFLDELGERIDQFDSDQDWDEIFTEASAKIE